MPTSFDVSRYVRAPKFDVAGGISLGHALISSAPKKSSKNVKAALANLVRDLNALNAIWTRAISVRTKGKDQKESDQAIDTAWRALFARLQGYAMLDSKKYPDALRAQVIQARLFPDGLKFLAMAFAQEWAESDKRLQIIASERLANDLDRLCGKLFLQEVKDSHAGYGKALGITQAKKAAPASESLVEPLRRLSSSISGYALKLIADSDLDNQKSVLALQRALKPIDDLRSSSRRASASSSDNGDDSGETPPPPEDGSDKPTKS